MTLGIIGKLIVNNIISNSKYLMMELRLVVRLALGGYYVGNSYVGTLICTVIGGGTSEVGGPAGLRYFYGILHSDHIVIKY